MSADVVATQSARRCNPVVTVEYVVLAHAQAQTSMGRRGAALAHGDQDAAQAGAGSVTDGPEVPVEPLRCAVD